VDLATWPARYGRHSIDGDGHHRIEISGRWTVCMVAHHRVVTTRDRTAGNLYACSPRMLRWRSRTAWRAHSTCYRPFVEKLGCRRDRNVDRDDKGLKVRRGAQWCNQPQFDVTTEPFRASKPTLLAQMMALLCYGGRHSVLEEKNL